jgi:hypothetical protein
MDQLVHLGRLRKGFMLALLGMNTHAPTLLMNIQTNVERLTRKIKFAKVIHGKPPFGNFFILTNTITESVRLAFPFQS